MPTLERMYYPGQLVRVFHHYEKLEEYHAGMWRIVRGLKRKEYIDAAGDLMRQADDFEESMRLATGQWPISCEANLTAQSVNKLAWLGHAGCCIATDSPEDCTRAAWHTLTQQEQDDANAAAQCVLDDWVEFYASMQEPHAGLFDWSEKC